MPANLIVALDVPSPSSIEPLVSKLPPAIRWYKVGLELYCAAGRAALDPLNKAGKHIFLDLKLHDIPRTVARAVRAVSEHGIGMLTLHAGGGPEMLAAAAQAAAEFGDSRPRLLAVTTLTSLDQYDLNSLGIERPLAEHTLALGTLAVNAGVDGLVCSVHEAAAFRERLGLNPLLVTPGIRPAGSNTGDQKRVATPKAAVDAGADFLVVGRPIVQAKDPSTAASAILREMTTSP